MATLFVLANLIAGVPWTLMIFWPRGPLTPWAARSWVFVGALSALYGILFVPLAPLVVPVLLAPGPEAIAALFARPEAATLAWIHFLAFDLAIGSWMYRDLAHRGRLGWRSGPPLTLTLMAGPLGLALHAALVTWSDRQTGMEERWAES